MELTEKKYTTQEGKEGVSYSFKMNKDLPLQKAVEFEKVAQMPPKIGEHPEYGTWYLARGMKYGDKFVGVFMSKKQIDDYSNLPIGKFTITRVPLEIVVTIKDKEMNKLVNGYEFNSLVSQPLPEITEAQKLAVMTEFKNGELTLDEQITLSGVTKKVVEFFPELANKE